MAKFFPSRIVLCALWLAGVSIGLWVVGRFEASAGPAGWTPAQWPVASRLTLDSHVDTLILFAHPQCPCTRASIEELNQLMARCQGKIATEVLFLQPTNATDEWVRTGRWQTAAAIPGVRVEADLGGVEARRFDAETSGYVVLYNPQGRLLFGGGITSSRGHVGDNAGEAAIVSLVAGRNVALKQTPVYGCSLTNCSFPTE